MAYYHCFTTPRFCAIPRKPGCKPPAYLIGLVREALAAATTWTIAEGDGEADFVLHRLLASRGVDSIWGNDYDHAMAFMVLYNRGHSKSVTVMMMTLRVTFVSALARFYNGDCDDCCC